MSKQYATRRQYGVRVKLNPKMVGRHLNTIQLQELASFLTILNISRYQVGNTILGVPHTIVVDTMTSNGLSSNSPLTLFSIVGAGESVDIHLNNLYGAIVSFPLSIDNLKIEWLKHPHIEFGVEDIVNTIDPLNLCAVLDYMFKVYADPNLIRELLIIYTAGDNIPEHLKNIYSAHNLLRKDGKVKIISTTNPTIAKSRLPLNVNGSKTHGIKFPVIDTGMVIMYRSKRDAVQWVKSANLIRDKHIAELLSMVIRSRPHLPKDMQLAIHEAMVKELYPN
jgi:hypothetical protein